MAGTVVALARAVDCATKMCANGRQAAERVALADEKDPFLFQKRYRTVWVILRLAGLKNQARFEQHVRHKKPNSSCSGGTSRENRRDPAERELEKASSGNCVDVCRRIHFKDAPVQRAPW